MTINSAIAAGVSGLIANSSALSAISQNIANANTVGFKQNSTQFEDLITTSSSNADYSAGGVAAITSQLVSQQGGSTQTSSNTDLSINGNGLFVVTSTATPTPADSRAFTRAGSFTVDANGNLENAAGFYLQGWPVSADGTVAIDPSNVAALQTINVGDVGGAATPTNKVSINANLDSTQTASTAALATSGTATLASGSASWSYDLANAEPGATVTITDSSGATVYTATNQNLAAGAGTFPWNGTNNQVTPATQLPNGGTYTLSITDASGAAVTPTSLAAAGAYNSTTNNMASGAVTPDATISIPISDSEGGQRTLQLDVLKSTTPNQWYAELVSSPASDVKNGAGVAGQLAAGTLTFDATGAIQLNQSSLFGDASAPSIDILGSSSAATLASNQVSWASSLGLGEQNIAFNLSSAPGGVTQLASKSLTESIDTNGTQFGNLDSVAIDKSGFVTATYSNGVSKQIAQVAIATFENENGLNPITGDAYQVSSTSGGYNLKTAGSGGAGTISPSSLESSTVDLSSQFSDLITTQTAYSASSKVITTADQMLQSLISIIQ